MGYHYAIETEKVLPDAAGCLLGEFDLAGAGGEILGLRSEAVPSCACGTPVREPVLPAWQALPG